MTLLPLAVIWNTVHHDALSDGTDMVRQFRQTRNAVLGLVLSAVFMPIASAAAAGESIPCSCVANGERVEVGRLFCIKTAAGKTFLARCERVLNNTSWTRIQDECPTARAGELPFS